MSCLLLLQTRAFLGLALVGVCDYRRTFTVVYCRVDLRLVDECDVLTGGPLVHRSDTTSGAHLIHDSLPS